MVRSANFCSHAFRLLGYPYFICTWEQDSALSLACGLQQLLKILPVSRDLEADSIQTALF